ncbi:MAG: APC family permease [Acetobacter sp.]|jgi:amino acid transporter
MTPSSKMPDFRKGLTAFDLTMIGFGSIFGSGWLFAAARVADLSGPASIISWIIGGIAVVLIGLVYCELGAALPFAGSVVRYPEQAHGPLAAFLTGSVTTIAFSSLIAIEIVAARQYADAWFGGLTRNSAGDPTLKGWLLQFAVLTVIYLLNRKGIRSFALVNNIVTFFKFMVPALVIILLLQHTHGANFTAEHFAPYGLQGIETAISAGGVIFAYLGLTPILSVAGEVQNPQRAIPVALMASVLMSMIVYALLQTAFIGALPADIIAHGWSGLSQRLPLPFHDIAILLGLGTLAALVVTDAVLSPTGTGNIYMSATPRVIYAWSRSGTFFKCFTDLNERTGVPEKALTCTFGLALFWTLPFPSWQALIGVVSSALMLSYAFAPVSAAALRRRQPELPRPFRLKFFGFLAPAAFIIATLIVIWTGWTTLRWMLPVLLAMTGAFLAHRGMTQTKATWQHEFRTGLWMPIYFIGLLAISYAGPFDGSGMLSGITTDVLASVFALLIHYYAAHHGLRASRNHTHSS